MLKQLVSTFDGTVVQEADLTIVPELPAFGGPWGDPEQYTWIDAPVTRQLELAKENKVQEIKSAFVQSTANGFTCSNGITMDAHIDAIGKLKSGYDLAAMLNQAIMDVRDFNNVMHIDIPLADVMTMIVELGSNYQSLWTKKNTILDTIGKKKKVANVKSLVW